MLHPAALIKLFRYNATLIRKQTAQITHAESLISLPASGQCYNWLLGHIVSARTFALHYVGESHVWTDLERQRYRNGSSGAFSAEDPAPLQLDQLLSAFEHTQNALERGLQRSSYEKLCKPSGYQSNSIGDSIAYFQFHEAHHVGQLFYLAQHVGKDGVWL
ncbi:MAG: DinB family protein [Candidatus Promineifilaceae bacterium]